MTLLGLMPTNDAAAYYRIMLPVGAAGGAVAPFATVPAGVVAEASTVVLSRVGVTAGVSQIRARGVRVVFDLDDDPTTDPPVLNPAFNRDATLAMIGAADIVTCTGPTLAARLRKLHGDVRIVPNLVRVTDWPRPEPAPGPPVVVLAGSTSHEHDWRLVARPLARLRARGVPFVLRICGHLPAYLAPLCDDYRPWQSFAGYAAMLRGGSIGLCPLPDTRFNATKSPIKAYEYSLSGMAVIGSPCQYGPVLRAAGLGHAVAVSEGDWGAMLQHYLEDATSRRADAARLRAYVETLDVGRHTEAIKEAYGV